MFVQRAVKGKGWLKDTIKQALDQPLRKSCVEERK